MTECASQTYHTFKGLAFTLTVDGGVDNLAEVFGKGRNKVNEIGVKTLEIILHVAQRIVDTKGDLDMHHDEQIAHRLVGMMVRKDGKTGAGDIRDPQAVDDGRH